MQRLGHSLGEAGLWAGNVGLCLQLASPNGRRVLARLCGPLQLQGQGRAQDGAPDASNAQRGLPRLPFRVSSGRFRFDQRL